MKLNIISLIIKWLTNLKFWKILKKTLMYLQDILSSNSTDNIQLQNIGAYLFNSGKKKLFFGVFPADKCLY